MATVRDLLFLVADSAMAEDELAAELRCDGPTVRACLSRLGALSIVSGPQGDARLWTAVPEDAAFDVVVAKARAAQVDVRSPLASFGSGQG
jgi:hypothetical protein